MKRINIASVKSSVSDTQIYQERIPKEQSAICNIQPIAARFAIQFVKNKYSINKKLLYSFGDPNGLQKSNFLRWWQSSVRNIDRIAYPNDPDTAGLTFLSEVVWAPWMETIWFGNIFEYRSAYFQDVMYSNNMPNREGALLYKDPKLAQTIALLYQRYKKFDQSSYSLSNGTFYNIFGTESLRIGRYKTPLTNDVILCVTDPLTYSDMKRYFNSFNILKYFHNLYLQQKRKRQYILNISDTNIFEQMVHIIEYSRISSKFGDNSYHSIPTKPLAEIKLGTSGIRVPLSVANSQYFLENLFQAIINQLLKNHSHSHSSSPGNSLNLTILIGGDGRMLNTLATEIFIRVATANNIAKILTVPQGFLSTPAASLLLQERSDIHAAIILTASHNPGGIRGSFGVKLNLNGGIQADDRVWKGIQREFENMKEVRIRAGRSILPSPELSTTNNKMTSNIYNSNTIIQSVDSVTPYINYLKKCFDIPKIISFIQKYGLLVTFDCMNGIAGVYLKSVISVLGLDESCLLRGESLGDFGGSKPDPNLGNANIMMDLFDVKPIDTATLLSQINDDLYDDSITDDNVVAVAVEEENGPLSSSENENREKSSKKEIIINNNVKNNVKVKYEDCPDIGFAFDADILGPGMAVSPAESLAVIAAYHEHIPYFKDAGGLQVTARSVATAPAIDRVAANMGMKCVQTPTGWKWISKTLKSGVTGTGTGTGSVTTTGAALGSSALSEKDGIWTAMAWLNVLAAANDNSNNYNNNGDGSKKGNQGKLIGVRDIMRRHWTRFGRTYTARLDFEGVSEDIASRVLTRRGRKRRETVNK
eukprot:gene1066-2085_t